MDAYLKVSVKHWGSYAQEFEWRFNGRKNECLFRDTLVRLLESTKLEFISLPHNA